MFPTFVKIINFFKKIVKVILYKATVYYRFSSLLLFGLFWAVVFSEIIDPDHLNVLFLGIVLLSMIGFLYSKLIKNVFGFSRSVIFNLSVKRTFLSISIFILLICISNCHFGSSYFDIYDMFFAIFTSLFFSAHVWLLLIFGWNNYFLTKYLQNKFDYKFKVYPGKNLLIMLYGGSLVATLLFVLLLFSGGDGAIGIAELSLIILHIVYLLSLGGYFLNKKKWNKEWENLKNENDNISDKEEVVLLEEEKKEGSMVVTEENTRKDLRQDDSAIDKNVSVKNMMYRKLLPKFFFLTIIAIIGDLAGAIILSGSDWLDGFMPNPVNVIYPFSLALSIIIRRKKIDDLSAGEVMANNFIFRVSLFFVVVLTFMWGGLIIGLANSGFGF